MKKRYLCAAIALMLIVLSSLPVFAAKTYMNDNAGILSADETKKVETELKKVSEEYGVDIVVLTVESLDGRSDVEIADDYYAYNNYADDGILLLYCCKEDIRYVSTNGYCIDAFKNNLSDITAAISEPMSNEDYDKAFIAFAKVCGEIIEENKKSDFVMGIVICVAVGLIVAAIVTGSMKGKLKSVAMNNRATNYVKDGSLNIVHSNDFFLYKNITRTEKKDNDSGTHKSSSGKTHGGGRV